MNASMASDNDDPRGTQVWSIDWQRREGCLCCECPVRGVSGAGIGPSALRSEMQREWPGWASKRVVV